MSMIWNCQGDTYEAAVDGILSHADNVAQAPGQNLAALGVVDGRLHDAADAEGLDHAAARGLGGGGRVDVVGRAAGHDEGVRAELGGGQGAGRVGALDRHAGDDLPALADLTRRGVIRIGRHRGEVGREERPAVGAEGDTMVGLANY